MLLTGLFVPVFVSPQGPRKAGSYARAPGVSNSAARRAGWLQGHPPRRAIENSCIASPARKTKRAKEKGPAAKAAGPGLRPWPQVIGTAHKRPRPPWPPPRPEPSPTREGRRPSLPPLRRLHPSSRSREHLVQAPLDRRVVRAKASLAFLAIDEFAVDGPQGQIVDIDGTRAAR